MAETEERVLKKAKTFCCAANEVIWINFQEKFHPAFSYHAIGKDQLIRGFSDVEICIHFNPQTFHTFVQIHSSNDSKERELRNQLQKSLPTPSHDSFELFNQDLLNSKTSFVPFGQSVLTYQHSDKSFQWFKCTLADCEQMQNLFGRMQKLALWMIEGADAIDTSDPHWTIYTLYESRESKEYVFAGYVSVYKFINPVSKGTKEQVERLRICQALVLPTYQRQGHGKAVVNCIMEECMASNTVYEVTVEDPVPAFSRLRDVVDVQNCIKRDYFSLPPNVVDCTTESSVSFATKELTDKVIEHVHQNLKITREQIHRCYEVLKLRFVNKNNEDEYKPYRLEVKRRLHKLYAEDLGAMDCADRKKSFLACKYEELEQHYLSILQAVEAKAK